MEEKSFSLIEDRNERRSITGILPDSYIFSYCEKENLISPYYISNIEAASYDLTAEGFYEWELNNDGDSTILKMYDSIMLKPNQFVFIKSKEIINMPDNMIGRVFLRNRFIRAGLVATAPLFQPGDKGSHVFVCIRNLSNYNIKLSREDTIVQIVFEVLSAFPKYPYDRDHNSAFKQSTSLDIPNDLIQNRIKEQESIEKRINDFETRIYTMVATFVGAFTAILALIIVNFTNDAFKKASILDIIKINISLAICISIILFFIMAFTYYITKEKTIKKKRTHKSTNMFLRKFQILHESHKKDLHEIQEVKSTDTALDLDNDSTADDACDTDNSQIVEIDTKTGNDSTTEKVSTTNNISGSEKYNNINDAN